MEALLATAHAVGSDAAAAVTEGMTSVLTLCAQTARTTACINRK